MQNNLNSHPQSLNLNRSHILKIYFKRQYKSDNSLFYFSPYFVKFSNRDVSWKEQCYLLPIKGNTETVFSWYMNEKAPINVTFLAEHYRSAEHEQFCMQFKLYE